MMLELILNNFERFVDIMKTGGLWSVIAVLFIMLIRSDRRYVRGQSELKDMLVAKIDNDVRTERTLEASTGAFQAIVRELDEHSAEVRTLRSTLEKMLLLSKNQALIEKPNDKK